MGLDYWALKSHIFTASAGPAQGLGTSCCMCRRRRQQSPQFEVPAWKRIAGKCQTRCLRLVSFTCASTSRELCIKNVAQNESVSAHSRAHLSTIVHVCPDCVPAARHNTAFTWTWMVVGQVNLQALKDIMSRKSGCRPWASPVSNKRARSRLVVRKMRSWAQLFSFVRDCSLLCLRAH